MEQVTHLKYILLIFEKILGLKVNFLKSSLAGIGIDDGDVNWYAQILCCKVEHWPLKYLGMTLGGSKKSRVFWDPVAERVNKRLACWKRSYISLGGRIILIKVAMANMPVYYMSLFKMPVKIVKVLEKYQWDFLWESGEKKSHLVNWKVACCPKSHGGLGVGWLKERNMALLVKWIWRFSTEKGSFWHSFISNMVFTLMDGTLIPLPIILRPYFGEILLHATLLLLSIFILWRGMVGRFIFGKTFGGTTNVFHRPFLSFPVWLPLRKLKLPRLFHALSQVFLGPCLSQETFMVGKWNG